MARLNEPPAPVESIEALKRRFVRQNREIARVNSTQSLRIRSLEAETSRLLSENIELREEAIRLRHELDKSRRWNNVASVKSKLEDKLAELGYLVNELGSVQNGDVNDSSPLRKRVERASSKRSPDQKNWKNALTLSEVTGGQDGRLPPIVEDKYFPRKTLDPEEILGILSDPANSADSPDFGPPPVSQFGERDPIKFDTTQRSPTQPGLLILSEDVAPALSSNLETRRKRRESSFSRALGDAQPSEAQPHSDKTSSFVRTNLGIGQSLKAGAKRKLSSRDDEGHEGVSTGTEKDDFRFNRTNLALAESTNEHENDIARVGDQISDKVSQDLAAVKNRPRDKPREDSSSTSTKIGRRALGEKNVNTDPVVSPVKMTTLSADERIVELKKRAASKPQDKVRTKDGKAEVKDVQHSAHQHVEFIASIEPQPLLQPIVVDLPPATPAQQDFNLFSPISTEPSVARPESRDTPPPPDIDTSNPASRATRRPRGSVSYAEPNLRAKMRRPTKELVDAVGADERVQRATSTKPEGAMVEAENVILQGSSTEKGNMWPLIIKKEDGTSDSAAWKSLPPAQTRETEREKETRMQRHGAEPTSPLRGKIGNAAITTDLPASVITERRRRNTTLQSDSGEAETHVNNHISSGAGTTIAALMAGGKHKKARDLGQAIDERGGHGRKDEVLKESLDVFEFNGSSSADGEEDGKGRTSGAVGGMMRTSKRSVSVPDSLRKAAEGTAIRGGSKPNVDSMPSASASASSRGSRRRDTLSTGTGYGGLEQHHSSARSSAVLSKSTTYSRSGHGSGESATSDSLNRAERAATRRRSMML